MGLKYKDRVQETTTTTGTGSLTMLGAVSGYQSFNSALVSGDTCYYSIADTANNAWEVGLGTFTSTETLARTTVIASSNSNALVSFAAGTKQVFITVPAQKMSSKFIYEPDGWNDNWNAAKAGIASTPASLLVIGDSVSQGAVASNWMTTSWPQLLKTYLLNTYAESAEFYITSHDAAVVTALGGTFNGTAPFSSLATARALNGGFGYGGIVYNTGTAVSAYITFVTPYACTDIDIIHLDFTAGTWKYAIDGGSLVTVTNTATQYQKRIQLTGLSNAVHTITMGYQSAAAVCIPLGLTAFKSRTAGLQFGLMSVFGEALEYWQSTGDSPADLIAALQGNGAATTGFGFPTQPNLAIIELGINDCSIAQTTALYFDGLRRMVQALRRGNANCSIIILAPCNPDTVNSDQTSGNFTNSANYAQFLQQMRMIADLYNCAFVNIHAAWGETPVTQAFMGSGQPHPNDAGHANIAAYIESII